MQLWALLPFASALGSGREDLIAASPSETTRADLGRLYDAAFRPLVGPDHAIFDGDAPQTSERPGEARGLWIQDGVERVLTAEASLWFAGGEVALTGTRERALYRAFAADRIVVLDEDRLRTSAVPVDAEWYLAAVYEGRMFEALCAGEHADLQVALEGKASWVFGSASLRVEGATREYAVQCSDRLLGLKARAGNEALSLSLTGSGDLSMFEADGDGRAVLVRYSRVPDGLRPAPPPEPLPVADGVGATAPSDGVRVTIRGVYFPRAKPNGESWDVLGGAPDVAFVALLDGRRVYASPVIQDHYSASFDAIILDDVPRRGTVAVHVWDQDLSAADSAGVITLDLHHVPSLTEPSSAEVRTDAGVTVVVELGPPGR